MEVPSPHSRTNLLIHLHLLPPASLFLTPPHTPLPASLFSLCRLLPSPSSPFFFLSSYCSEFPLPHFFFIPHLPLAFASPFFPLPLLTILPQVLSQVPAPPSPSRQPGGGGEGWLEQTDSLDVRCSLHYLQYSKRVQITYSSTDR